MKFWLFSDGMYVTSTTAEYQEFLGKKLIKIDDTPISEVYEKLLRHSVCLFHLECAELVDLDIRRVVDMHIKSVRDSAKPIVIKLVKTTKPVNADHRKWRNQAA